ncbi:hypothetical protein RI129_003169 [Pyrocoelia pectoralis]|uniref:MADF domain-containing protein n=1 Tax=Pyrocoelia pectoralis TaxID=417401 RepID=A0AAN7ZMT5_9COLE
MPVLWKVKSDEYMDRDKKAQALEQLLTMYQEKFPSATTEDVKNKFNSLRTNFRKELKKIKHSMKSGAGTEEVYESTLWYFDAMTFLVDQETPSSSINTIEGEFVDAHTEVTNIPLPAKKCKTRPNKDATQELITLACNRLKEPVSDETHIVTTWAKELKNMIPQQQILAKKCINDVIFEGQMGTLHRDSVKINEAERYGTPASHSSHSTASYTQIYPDYTSQNPEPSTSHYFSSFLIKNFTFFYCILLFI